MPNYLVDLVGKTPLHMWSNSHDGNGDFASKIHLVHPDTDVVNQSGITE